MIFRMFESLVDAFRDPEEGMPPQTVWRFYGFYLKQVWKVLLIACVVGLAAALVDVSLLGCLGQIVDLTRNPGGHVFQDHALQRGGMGPSALMRGPLLIGLQYGLGN